MKLLLEDEVWKIISKYVINEVWIINIFYIWFVIFKI